ncbi:CRISPR-associated protein Cas4 [Halorhabdus rudnickae]|uniref:CRISPR-associated protein Cas4 n=1 Tax=Halorhabdus rudnickae TaxID=1775544 RepID=UPI0010832781|nr:hypothetical protein [Halorhabdus rudnickae]
MPTFRDLEIAAYCPRQLYYRRRADVDPEIPAEVAETRALAFEYPRLLARADLSAEPIAVTGTQYSSALHRAKACLDCWDRLVDPAGRDVFLEGRDCRGIAHKVIEDPLAPSLVFAGEPPENGVWGPQSVRLVAAALALSYERERPIEVAFVEYPAHGVVRQIDLSAHRRATYRATLRTVASIDGPPSRVDNRRKCNSCDYREECGVRTRSLRSLL